MILEPPQVINTMRLGDASRTQEHTIGKVNTPWSCGRETVSSEIWLAANCKQVHEPIKKKVKESVLNSATESSCHHNLFLYREKHL